MGFTEALPPLDDRLAVTSSATLVEGGWQPKISDNLKAKLSVGDRTLQWYNDQIYLYPPGYVGMSANGPTTYTNGMIAGPHIQEEASYLNGELFYDGLAGHELLVGAGYKASMVLNAWQEDNYDPLTGIPVAQITTYNGSRSWLSGDIKRFVTSMFAQDQIRATERLNLTAGLRYDGYSDIGGRVSPRLALVYEFNPSHYLKAQYSEAFRPPDYMELYFINNPIYKGNPHLGSETIRTSELEYVFKGDAKVLKVTAFYSDVANLITVTNGVYANGTGALSRGLEGEWEIAFGGGLKATGNVSYDNTVDFSTGTPIAGSTNWLGNAWIIYNPNRNVSFNLQYQFVGDRFRNQGDPRGNLPLYDLFNLSIATINFGARGLTAEAGIRNIFNEIGQTPSSIYQNDIPNVGRTYWVGLSYDFTAN